MMQQAPGVAASSECSSGCQSGWTTYLDDDDDDGDRSSSRSSSCGTNRHFARAKAAHQFHCHDRYSCSEEDDLSMISDASSGPRHHQKCSNDAGQAGGAAASSARRRVADAAATRRQSKKAAAAALLEDTASSPAFLGYSKVRGPAHRLLLAPALVRSLLMEFADARVCCLQQATHLFEEATSVYGYGAGTDEPMMMEMANAADFSCAFSATTTAGFKVRASQSNRPRIVR